MNSTILVYNSFQVTFKRFVSLRRIRRFLIIFSKLNCSSRAAKSNDCLCPNIMHCFRLIFDVSIKEDITGQLKISRFVYILFEISIKTVLKANNLM